MTTIPDTREARKSRRQAKRREEILEAALLELFARGLNHLTIAAVAARAGISKPSVYYYFKTKEEILGALSVSLIEAEVEFVEAAIEGAASGVAALEAMIHAKVDYYQRGPERFRAVYLMIHQLASLNAEVLQSTYALSSRLNGALEALLARDQQEGRLHPDIQPRPFVNVAWMGVQGILTTHDSLTEVGGALKFPLAALIEELCGCIKRSACPAVLPSE